MPYLDEIHKFLSQTPLITAVGPVVFIISAISAIYYLRLSRLLKVQFSLQQAASLELQKLSAAVEHSPASIVITDNKGVIEYVNLAFCRLTGYSCEEALGQHTRILKGEGQPDEYYKAVWDTISSGNEWSGEFFNRRKDGTCFWEFASISPIKDEQDVITHYVAVKENITERKQMLAFLDKMAHTDKLTELPNRNLFFDRLEFVIAVSCRDTLRFALLYIDLDGFKLINDTYGHDAGDQVLQEAARRFKLCVRESDTVARMGGDEFTIILNNLKQINSAATVAKKIMKEFMLPFTLSGGIECRLGVSIGISYYPDDSIVSEHLLNAADTAMYAVKKSGKNGYCNAHDIHRDRLSRDRENLPAHDYF